MQYKKYQFTIHGNQDDPNGNPIGYKRLLRGKIRDADVKYIDWCNFVRDVFYQENKNIDLSWKNNFEKMTSEKPLTTTNKNTAKLSIKIEFAKDGTRADCDNVFKGISDALFFNDKYVMQGYFEGKLSDCGKGKVDVDIIIYE